VRAFAPGEGARVHRECHPQRRLLDLDRWEGPRVRGIGDRVADPDIWYAGDRNDVAGTSLIDFLARETLEREQLGQPL
jgi:hypothetical protein